jgi:HK97 family phage prohead protease
MTGGMLWGAAEGGLELRRQDDGGARLTGRFPYNSVAVLSDGGRTGRPRKERFAPRAFEFRVDDPKADVHLLVGHDYGKPLASKLAGTLKLLDAAEALIFRATITAAVAETSHGRDALALIGAGLAIGLSPGFRIPPERAVPKAEEVEQEPVKPEAGMHGAIIRTILAALLFELSLVTAPAYPEAQVEMRSWQPTVRTPAPVSHFRRWRA